jgi:hypothetical protein
MTTAQEHSYRLAKDEQFNQLSNLAGKDLSRTLTIFPTIGPKTMQHTCAIQSENHNGQLFAILTIALHSPDELVRL